MNPSLSPQAPCAPIPSHPGEDGLTPACHFLRPSQLKVLSRVDLGKFVKVKMAVTEVTPRFLLTVWSTKDPAQGDEGLGRAGVREGQGLWRNMAEAKP